MQAVKEQIQKEKDLEGIDLSNIVSGGRRSRAAAAAPRVSYRSPAPLSPVHFWMSEQATHSEHDATLASNQEPRLVG